MTTIKRAAAAIAMVAAAGLAGAAGWGGPRLPTVAVTIRHSRFEPDRLALPPGTRVRFVVHNADPIDHEFILGDMSVQLRHEHGREGSHHEAGAVSVPADSTTSTTWTLRPGQGAFFGCHLPGHWVYGMQGVVTPR